MQCQLTKTVSSLSHTSILFNQRIVKLDLRFITVTRARADTFKIELSSAIMRGKSNFPCLLPEKACHACDIDAMYTEFLDDTVGIQLNFMRIKRQRSIRVRTY